VPPRRLLPLLAPAAIALAAGVLAGCGRTGPAPVATAGAGPRFEVVAAEGFWGSIAAQLGGPRVYVRSLVDDPGVDPHSYQPSAADARAFVASSVAIVNGLGYDPWATALLQGSASPRRTVLDVGAALRLPAGANPHRWYYPADVARMVALITAAYERTDPADAGFFAARRRAFETVALARYDALRAEIRRRYAGVPVGYSESIFQGLGEDLGLRLLTPRGYAKAIAEGTEVTARDAAQVEAQARGRRIALWVVNSQNATPDVERVTRLARARGIPVATITETPVPAHASFEQWQVAQLEGILRGLRRARGS
jgi:zinc/manganese transport system substrate-binding protein